MASPLASPAVPRVGDAPLSAAGTRLAGLLAGAITLSSLALMAILAMTSLTLAVELFKFVLLAAAMLGLAAYARVRGMHWTVSDSAAVVALVTLSLLLCGLVSSTALRLGLPLTDALLARGDALVGIEVEKGVVFVAGRPALATFLHFAYNASGLLCAGAVVAMLARRDRPGLWRIVATLAVAMHLTALASIPFPARGAIAAYGLDVLQGQGLPYGAGTYWARDFAYFYSGRETLIGLANLNGVVCFPSFHTVMALVIMQACAGTRLRWPALLWSAVTIVSTVPMGGHYCVDIVGGFLVWTIAYLLAVWACRPLSHRVDDRRLAEPDRALAPAVA